MAQDYALPASGDRRWDIAWRNQLQVLPAIFFREADSRHGRRFLLGYLASGIEPLSVVLILAFLFTALARHTPYGGSLLLFLGTGVFPVYLFIHSAARMRQPLGVSKYRLRFPLERPLDLVMVHAFQHFTMNVLVMGAFFAAVYALGVDAALPQNPMIAILAMFNIFLLGTGAGILNSVIARIFPVWDLFWPVVTRTTLHFSGVYYVVAALPPPIRDLFLWNPVMDGTNIFRLAFYPYYPDFGTRWFFLFMSGFTMLTLGLLFEASTRRFLEAKE